MIEMIGRIIIKIKLNVKMKFEFIILLMLVILGSFVYLVIPKTIIDVDPIFLPSIDVTELKSCKTEYYTEKKSIFKDVIKTSTSCLNTTGKNTDCREINTTYRGFDSYEFFNKSREVCVNTGFDIDGKILDCKKNGVKCYRNEFFITVKYPYCSNINSPSCGEGSGECCEKIDIRNISNRKGFSSYSKVESVEIG